MHINAAHESTHARSVSNLTGFLDVGKMYEALPGHDQAPPAAIVLQVPDLPAHDGGPQRGGKSASFPLQHHPGDPGSGDEAESRRNSGEESDSEISEI